MQGALAAGLLGGGSRFLGVTEDAGRFLADALAAYDGGAAAARPTTGGTSLRASAVQQRRGAGGYVPGLGHPVHKDGDPRTPVLIADRRRGGRARTAPAAVRGDRTGAPRDPRPHAAAQRRRRLRRGAVRPRLRPAVLRGFALLARAAGLLGHLAEEMRRPIGLDIYEQVDRAIDYRS